MHLGNHSSIWGFLVLHAILNHTEVMRTEHVSSITKGVTGTKGPGPDVQNVDYWRSLLPEYNKVCPGTNICEMTERDIGNRTLDRNTCCMGCSCDKSCTEELDCCHDTQNANSSSSTQKCLLPARGQYNEDSLDQFIVYKLVVTIPETGCKLDARYKDLEKTFVNDKHTDPFTSFRPVYSKSLNLNLMNEYLARCYGAGDTDKWIPRIMYDGLISEADKALTQFYSDFNATGVYILFLPPNLESNAPEHVCHKVINTCFFDYKETFPIPPVLQMDRWSIIKACDDGPRALYMRSQRIVFKNVFCAICNRFTLRGRIACTKDHDIDQGRGIPKSLTGLVDFKALVLPDGIDGKSKTKCYKNIRLKESKCAVLHCPSLQTRSANGNCVFPVEKFTVACNSVQIPLNLSTTKDMARFVALNTSRIDLLTLLQQYSPWVSCWQIMQIGVRLDTDNLELLILLDCKMLEIDIGKINRHIQKILGRTWTVAFDEENKVDFIQQLDKHGVFTLVQPDENHKDVFLKPTWITILNDDRVTDIPLWRLVYDISFADDCLLVSKMFFCKQIEIAKSDFEFLETSTMESLTSKWQRALYLNASDRFLYPGEYMVFESDDRLSPHSVRVCVEDSGYEQVYSSAFSSLFSLPLLVGVIFTAVM